MRTSRTSPTKLASAPIFVLREIARTSAPRSKPSRWTEIFIRRSPEERTRSHRRPLLEHRAAPCPDSRPHAHCATARRPRPRPRRASGGARAGRRLSSPWVGRPFPRRSCPAVRAATRKRAGALSTVKLRVRQEADPVALADGLAGGIVDEAVGPRGRG